MKTVAVYSGFLFLTLLIVSQVLCLKEIYEVRLPSIEDEAEADGSGDANGTIWAVLVAGSNEYYNYRHQADVCHAYQILLRNGVAPEHIIVFMYDDIAYNSENPTPGVIINRPNGTNVYPGVKIDYKGEDVKPDVFLKVLLGDEKGVAGIGTGRVLKSRAKDHVFINFVDHGAPGIIAFPSEELHARELISTLKKMHNAKQYAKLVFYLEACESGSMFKKLLPAHWNIFATTAANDKESSYACYMDDYRNTFLGDVYSVMWMENSDQVDLEKETLQRQFVIVRNETNTSHVQEFGDKTLRQLPVADFLGEQEAQEKVQLEKHDLNPVPSHEAVLHLLRHQILRANSTEEREALEWKLKRFNKLRKLVQTEMREIVSTVVEEKADMKRILNSHLDLTNWDCYENVVKYYSKNCFSIARNPYVGRQLYILVNLCEEGWGQDAIIKAMSSSCNHFGLEGIQ